RPKCAWVPSRPWVCRALLRWPSRAPLRTNLQLTLFGIAKQIERIGVDPHACRLTQRLHLKDQPVALGRIFQHTVQTLERSGAHFNAHSIFEIWVWVELPFRTESVIDVLQLSIKPPLVGYRYHLH